MSSGLLQYYEFGSEVSFPAKTMGNLGLSFDEVKDSGSD